MISCFLLFSFSFLPPFSPLYLWLWFLRITLFLSDNQLFSSSFFLCVQFFSHYCLSLPDFLFLSLSLSPLQLSIYLCDCLCACVYVFLFLNFPLSICSHSFFVLVFSHLFSTHHSFKNFFSTFQLNKLKLFSLFFWFFFVLYILLLVIFFVWCWYVTFSFF